MQSESVIINDNQVEGSLTSTQSERINRFLEDCKNIVGTNYNPQFVVIAPGRVNLIGDHLDYHGYPVLPMTIEKNSYIAIEFTDFKDKEYVKDKSDLVEILTQKFKILNKDPMYPAFQSNHSFAYGPQLCLCNSWQNYILCGYHGILAKKLLNIKPDDIIDHAEALSKQQNLVRQVDSLLIKLPALTMFIDSDLPSASGLSSSSSLVCASAMATNVFLSTFLGKEKGDSLSQINREELAYDCSKFEWLVGTRGGAMDQAVIMTGQRGFAKYIEFEPLKCHNVELPEKAIWIVSHSGQSYQKSSTQNFNKLVMETKFGAAIIVKRLNVESISIDQSITLKKVQTYLNISETQFLTTVKQQVFNEKFQFTIEEICKELHVDEFELKKLFNISDDLFNSNSIFKVADRVYHVLSEAKRVEEFKDICKLSKDLTQLGKLMLASHESLKNQCEVSTPTLDLIVETAINAGAYGSRLTGAGFGGCVVSLVDENSKRQVVEALKKISKLTFETKPQGGCQVVQIGKNVSNLMK